MGCVWRKAVGIPETWQFVTNQYKKLDKHCDDALCPQNTDLGKHLKNQKNLTVRALGPVTVVALDFLFVRTYREAMDAQ